MKDPYTFLAKHPSSRRLWGHSGACHRACRGGGGGGRSRGGRGGGGGRRCRRGGSGSGGRCGCSCRGRCGRCGRSSRSSSGGGSGGGGRCGCGRGLCRGWSCRTVPPVPPLTAAVPHKAPVAIRVVVGIA